ncbi:hypothetical protein G7Z17_g5661 [Cylindrodendrum hubeiense]|uniref:NACHT domain-containing protein n=1 Tax=Cylindrodendrum hubeiense TaxID=595255 RepID=A0A9P5H6P2_9HYPO|nr:hypothetical protein G7Z17_g5661 [Cylindrodendrum hubeiense]
MVESADETLNRRRNPKAIPVNLSDTSGELWKCLRKMRVSNPIDVLSDIKIQKGGRVGTTCEWILKREEFLTWGTDENPQLLRLVGSPGIGKTILSTFLVEILEKKVQKATGKLFGYFFCDDKSQERRTQTAILRSLIWQLLRQRNELFKHLQSDFESQGSTFFDNFSALWRIFQCMLNDKRVGEVFILIDALDESESSTRKGFLQGIKELFKSATVGTGKFKFIITCRPGIIDVEDQLKGIGTSLRVDSAEINNDLSEYIDFKVNGLTDLNGEEYPSELKDRVRDTLRREAGGTFLWVSLMLAGLNEVLMSHVEAKLKSLPHGLDNTYAAILDRIDSGKRETAQFILHCMVAARRPLRKTEIQTAFATWNTGSIQRDKDVAAYADILSACSSILYLSRVDNEDDATLNFCHQSVKDFLLSKPSTINTWYHTVGDEANLFIFKACCAYLSAEELNDDNLVVHRRGRLEVLLKTNTQELRSHFSQYLFLEYSSREWEHHAVASYSALLGGRHGLPINFLNTTLRNAWLLRAIREGQEAIVKLLIENGTDVEYKDSFGLTPLFLSVTYGQEAIVKLLLENGADIESKDVNMQTSLSWTAEKGHEAIVKLLLENGAAVESKDVFGQTPLFLSVTNGYEVIVKLLLEKGADIESKDRFDRTPLLLSIVKKNTVIAKLLLENGTNVESRDVNRRTPLLWAASNRHEATVKLLLENGAAVDSKERFDRTPLLLSVTYRDEAIVKLLLKNGAVE